MSTAARFEIVLACVVACGNAPPPKAQLAPLPSATSPPQSQPREDVAAAALEERIAIVAEDKVVHLRGSGALAIDEVIVREHAPM